MSTRNNKQLIFLVALIAILGLTLFVGPRINRQTTASVVQAEQNKKVALPAVINDARIRLDLVDKDREMPDAGSENVFQYRTKAPVVPPAGSRGATDPFAGAPPPPVVVTPPRPTGPPPPPPPPPITLRFQGFARNDAGGALTAFLSDDTGHYNVRAGDVLMGRFRIAAVTDSAVEVEDLQYNRRQSLPLLK